MKILAFDTCFGRISLSILIDGKIVLEKINDEQSRQAELLFPLIEESLREKNLSYDELDALAVTIGPGSFTGVRIGLAAAQGICFAAELPLVGVTTLEAAASGAAHQIKGSSKVQSIFSCLDASREQLYAEEFTFFDNEPKIKSVGSARLINYSELAEMLPNHEFIFAGNARHIIERLNIKGKKFSFDDDNRISASAIAMVAHYKLEARKENFNAKAIAPFYIREPDAKLPTKK